MLAGTSGLKCQQISNSCLKAGLAYDMGHIIGLKHLSSVYCRVVLEVLQKELIQPWRVICIRTALSWVLMTSRV